MKKITFSILACSLLVISACTNRSNPDGTPVPAPSAVDAAPNGGMDKPVTGGNAEPAIAPAMATTATTTSTQTTAPTGH